MADLTTYSGGCHCGNVRFDVQLDLGAKILACNCSICSKMGWFMSFVPAAQFTLLSGQNSLSDYQFNKKKIHHLFCSTCGIRSFARATARDGAEMVAINLRCLEDLDIDTLQPTRFDGKSL